MIVAAGRVLFTGRFKVGRAGAVLPTQRIAIQPLFACILASQTQQQNNKPQSPLRFINVMFSLEMSYAKLFQPP